MEFQHTFDLDETLAFLDEFNLSAANNGRYSPTCSTDDSDASISSLLSQFNGSERGCEVTTTRTTGQKRGSDAMLQPQQQQAIKPLRKKKVARASRRESESSTKVTTDGTAAPAPVPAAAVGPAKKPRKLPRIEILKLREQVEELQTRYVHLQELDRSRAQQRTESAGARTPNNTTVAPRSVWLELVVEQSKQRLKSEALNSRLRVAVSHQRKVMNSLQALLRKRVPLQELGELLESPAKSESNLQSPQKTLQADMWQSLESQFHEMDLVRHGISAGKDTGSVFSTSRANQDALRGPTFEFTTNTPVSCNFELLGDAMWRRVSELKALSVESSSHLARLSQKPSRLFVSRDMRVQMTVPSKFGELQLDGMFAIGEFKDVNRIVLTVASAYTVKGSDLMFRESSWTIVSEGAAEKSLSPWAERSSSASLFQTFYRLHSEKRDPSSSTGSVPFTTALDENTKYTQELVLQLLSDQLREYMAQLQHSLLSEVGSIASNVLEVKCRMIECLC